MRRTFDIEIDGEGYSVTYFSATKGTQVLIELSKIIGEPMAALGAQDNVLDIDVTKVLPTAAKSLFSQLDKEKTVLLIKEILDSVSQNNQPIMPQFEIKFAGRTGHMMKLVMATLKVQFSDLGNALSSIVQVAKG